MSVTQIYNTLFLIFFMGGFDGLNLGPIFDAEVTNVWGFPVRDSAYDRAQREHNGPANQNPFSGFSYYEDRANTASSSSRSTAKQLTMGDDWNIYDSSARGIQNAWRAMKLYKNIFPGAGFKREREGQMTKDMILGPYRKKRIGSGKKVNIGKQLTQLVDDTKVLKQNFKFKLQSDSGLRNWVQIVCRQRATPGTTTNNAFVPHGKMLLPNLDSTNNLISNNPTFSYYGALPPVPRGTWESDLNTIDFGTSVEGPGTENLFFLNMPLTYLEQDMFNMGLGPGKRNYTQQMLSGQSLNTVIANPAYNPVAPTLVEGTTALPNGNEIQTNWMGTDMERLTDMMQAVHPTPQKKFFNLIGTFQGWKGQAMNEQKAAYPFREGWGINQLDYNVFNGSAGTTALTDTEPSQNDPQWIKTNNSANTVATIKSGKLTFTFNNLGETQAYITTLIVVNKHVNDLYYSMPEALTDTYIKAAQAYIASGEWSITNNITTVTAAQSIGKLADPYMYLTHPSIKPFGRVPTQFLKNFLEHFTIKYQTTQKLGIGERATCSYNLGGLQYSAESISMDSNIAGGGEAPPLGPYYPAGDAWADGNIDNKVGTTVTTKTFPDCCQQGTTHVLFGLQGMSLPHIESSVDPDVTTIKGRWAAQALVDISGTYTEVIAPLSTAAKKPPPLQKTFTNLPDQSWEPIATTMPRVRTTENGAMSLKLT